MVPLALLVAAATPALVFVFLFPRLPGFKITGNPWLAAVVLALAVDFCFGCAYGMAGCASLIMGFWAAMGGGSGGIPIILIVTFGIAAAFVCMITTALITASQGAKSVGCRCFPRA